MNKKFEKESEILFPPDVLMYIGKKPNIKSVFEVEYNYSTFLSLMEVQNYSKCE